MAEHHSPESGEHMPEHEPSEGSERVREVIRDGFYTMLGAASWAFEKSDEMAHIWLDQGRTSGEEGRRRFDEFAERTRRAGEDLGRRVQDSVRSARSSMPLATREQVANLERQVAELTRQIESLKAGGGTPPAPPPSMRERPPVS
jgi:polyhydroxyalkanoate synthesis regulator phasin